MCEVSYAIWKTPVAELRDSKTRLTESCWDTDDKARTRCKLSGQINLSSGVSLGEL